MTHRPAIVPSLPLSVTCTADTRFADTLTALARRVAAGTGDAPAADRFTSAFTAGVLACLGHLEAAPGRILTVELTASDTDVQGHLHWGRLPDDATFESGLEATLGGVADRVECGHRGDDAFCRVTCLRG